MLKRNYIHRKDQIPEDWNEHCLVLWEEDDALPADREHGEVAFMRISGIRGKPNRIQRIVEDDTVTDFYRGGWIWGYNAGLSWVGVLVKNA